MNRLLVNRPVVTGLFALLILQGIWALLSGVQARTEEVPIGVGGQLPFAVGGWPSANLADQHEDDQHCRSAFICTPMCAFCGRLAREYAETIQDTTPTHLQPLWFITGDSVVAREWAMEHGIAAPHAFSLTPTRRSRLGGKVYGHIWFTPLRVIVTPELIVRDIRPSDQLVDAVGLRLLCRHGAGSSAR